MVADLVRIRIVVFTFRKLDRWDVGADTLPGSSAYYTLLQVFLMESEQNGNRLFSAYPAFSPSRGYYTTVFQTVFDLLSNYPG